MNFRPIPIALLLASSLCRAQQTITVHFAKDLALDSVRSIANGDTLGCAGAMLYAVSTSVPTSIGSEWKEISDSASIAELPQSVKQALDGKTLYTVPVEDTLCDSTVTWKTDDAKAEFFHGPPIGQAEHAERPTEEPDNGGSAADTVDHVAADQRILDAIARVEKFMRDSLKDDRPDAVYLSIGGQFDFLEKVSVSGLYFDMNFYVPRIASKGLFQHASIAGKVAQGQFSKGIFFEDSDTNLVAEFNLFDGDHGLDSARILNERYRLSRTNELKYAFMQLDVRWNLTDSMLDKDEFGKKRDPYRSNVAFSLPFAEYYLYSMKVATDPRLLTRDTILAPKDTSLALLPYRPFDDGIVTAQTRRMYAMNVGAGLCYRYCSDRTLVAINGHAGISFISRGDNTWFYKVDFEYTSRKYGVKFGGEVRYNFLGSPIPSDGIQQLKYPVANFYIAKTFSGSALMRFVTEAL